MPDRIGESLKMQNALRVPGTALVVIGLVLMMGSCATGYRATNWLSPYGHEDSRYGENVFSITVKEMTRKALKTSPC